MGSKDSDRFKSVILDLIKGYHRITQENKPFIPCETFLNFGGAICDEKELANMFDFGLGFWLTAEKWTKKFQEGMEDALRADGQYIKCLAVNSGSSANLLAFSTLTSYKLGDRRIKAGDEVITIAACFPTTITPAIQYGCIPVFVDVDLNTLNIDINEMKKALSAKTKAVMIAHTLGNVFNIDEVIEFCKVNGLWLVCDCCDALGGTWRGRHIETFGDISTHSYYPPHIITTGEGGMAIINNPELYKIAYSMRNWGRDCMCDCGQDNKCGKRHSSQHGKLPYGYDHKYVCSHFGYNLKFTDMQAAVGVAQLEKLPSFIEARVKNWTLLKQLTSDLPLITQEPLNEADPCWFGFSMITDGADQCRELVAHLENAKIQTRKLFMGNILKQPCFTDNPNVNYRVIGDLPNTDRIMNSLLWIGVYPGLSTEKINYMGETIRRFYK